MTEDSSKKSINSPGNEGKAEELSGVSKPCGDSLKPKKQYQTPKIEKIGNVSDLTKPLLGVKPP